jgi:hypothetical protein
MTDYHLGNLLHALFNNGEQAVAGNMMLSAMDIRELLGIPLPELLRWAGENMLFGGSVAWQIKCRRRVILWRSLENERGSRSL